LRYGDGGATRLAMRHLAAELGEKPIHVIGYSIGAALALDFTLDALDRRSTPVPASLVLISPAVGIHPIAGLAVWKQRLSMLPGLGHLGWLVVEPEFDPYKYNSFATNAAVQAHLLTRSVRRRPSVTSGRVRPDLSADAGIQVQRGRDGFHAGDGGSPSEATRPQPP
jgi:alpha-beta hydrolase superfamily lysophospholipase